MDVTDEATLFELARGEPQAYEQAEHQRKAALYPDISKITKPEELYKAMVAQREAQGQEEAKKTGGSK